MSKDALYGGINAAVVTAMNADLSIDLNRMAAQCQMSLLTIPRTARRRTQLRHNFEQIIYRWLFFHEIILATETQRFEFAFPLCLCASVANLQNYQIVAMHEFHAREFFGADFFGGKFRNAAGEFRSVQIANPHHVSGGKIAFATRDAGRQ